MLLTLAFASILLPSGIRFHEGPSNRVALGRDAAVYGVPPGAKPAHVLLTHARRDAIVGAAPAWIVPAAERELFENPGAFWTALETGRFHDYAQLGTKVPIAPLRVERAVTGGDAFEAGGMKIRVLDTPGYTRGAVSYLIEAGGKRIACTGDLIYGDGRLFDLYSLQDAVPEAKARGYHGYAARAAALISSLRAVAAARPDVILPARGPAIADPQTAIATLIARLQTFLASHFETDALRWYWGDDNHRIRARAVERPLDILPMAEQRALPPEILAIGNSRVILSRDGAAFVVDAGYKGLLPELRKLRDAGRLRGVEGIWITHYHDDHTDFVNDVAREFGAPVYFTSAMAEVLDKPGWFRLPCLTTRPIPVSGAKRDGDTMRWREYELTFWNFPGQTLYHGGLLARHDDGRAFLFAGDSFTPSGMDDYCMQNRVFLREGEGYGLCLRRIASLPRDAWVLNQHVAPMFRYTPEQIARMQTELRKRSAALADLSPWPEINYMVDESWSRIHPYGSEARPGATIQLELRIFNHAPRALEYRATWNPPAGWTIVNTRRAVTIPARKEGLLTAQLRAGSPGLHLITADLAFGGRVLRQWTEALVRVK